MAITTTFNSLTSVIPSELNYTFKSMEELNKQSVFFSNGFSYNKYSIFSNLQDAALSKNNAVFLTDCISLSSFLKEKPVNLTLTSMPALIYLKQYNKNIYIRVNGETVVGGSSENKTPIFFALVADNKAELLVSKTLRLEVSKTYPYTVTVATKATTNEQMNRQQFEVDAANGKLTLKTITEEGPRYLAFDSSSKLRATGVILNSKSTNNYMFSAIPISRTEITKGLALDMMNIKYFNQFESFGNKKNVKIQDFETANTHWLVSTTLKQLANEPNNVAVNIMPLKTNFTPSGTFLTKPNE